MNCRKKCIRNILNSILLVLLFCAYLHAETNKDKRYRVVVFELQSNTVQEVMLKISRIKLEVGLLKTPVFQLVTREEQQKILQEHKIYRACKDKLCVQEFGRLFSSDLNVIGSIEYSSDNYFYNIKVIKTENAEVLLSYSYIFKDQKDVIAKTEEVVAHITKEIYAAYNKEYIFSHYTLNLQFLYFYPIASMQKIVNNGYGTLLQFTMHDFYLNTFVHANVGVMYFTGHENSKDHAFFVPFYCGLGYRFVIKPIELSPVLGFGGIAMTYTHKQGEQGFFDEKTTRSSLNILSMAGITAAYNIKGFKIFCGIYDFMSYEKSGISNSLSGSLGLAMVF